MSFLKIGDRAAGAIKSGGTTRRAAKMVVVDIDHPDIEQYINWKVKEEQKVAALVTGSQDRLAAPQGDHEGLRQLRGRRATTASTRQKNPALKREVRAAKKAQVPRELHPAASSSSPGRATPTSNSRSTTPTGTRRPISPSPARTRTTPSASPTSSSTPSRRTATGTSPPASTGKVDEDAEGARAVGADRLRRLGLGRSRHPVPHHDQRLAHLPGVGRRSARRTRARNTCSSTTRPAISPRSTCSSSATTTNAASTSTPSSMPSGCGRSSSKSR